MDAPLPETAEELKRELQQLRKELARVTTQRDILKKLPCLLVEAPREMKIGTRWVEARADAKAA